MEQPCEVNYKKKINLLKAKDVEVMAQNENRQVVKKKQIVIEANNEVDEMKAVGPKLPLQENHRGDDFGCHSLNLFLLFYILFIKQT